MQPEEFKQKVSRIVNSIRQNRYKLEQYLITMQSQQQVILDSLQRLMDEQLALQGNITGSLSQFEEKAGTGQGLQGIFYGNPLLKSEIMQKRVVLEQSLQQASGNGLEGAVQYTAGRKEHSGYRTLCFSGNDAGGKGCGGSIGVPAGNSGKRYSCGK